MIEEDGDGDGFEPPEDCDDNNYLVHPGAEETPYDGEDQDCDGMDVTDVDEDGFDAEVAGGRDCNDERDDVSPEAEESCGNVRDDNCNGVIDENCEGAAAFDPEGMWWTCAYAPSAPFPLTLLVVAALAFARRR